MDPSLIFINFAQLFTCLPGHFSTRPLSPQNCAGPQAVCCPSATRPHQCFLYFYTYLVEDRPTDHTLSIAALKHMLFIVSHELTKTKELQVRAMLKMGLDHTAGSEPFRRFLYWVRHATHVPRLIPPAAWDTYYSICHFADEEGAVHPKAPSWKWAKVGNEGLSISRACAAFTDLQPLYVAPAWREPRSGKNQSPSEWTQTVRTGARWWGRKCWQGGFPLSFSGYQRAFKHYDDNICHYEELNFR